MEIKKYLKALPVVAALLLTASCSNEDEIVEAPQPAQTRIVPFTVTVNSGPQTRATVDWNYYKFETTDKLWVWNEDGDIYGELSWKDGSGDGHGGTYSGEFTGTLTVEAGATLETSTTLYTVIKSKDDQILGANLAAFKANGFEPKYASATTYASSKEDAVRMFSYFKATSTYGDHNFDFDGTQNTSFLSFDITLEDGTVANASVNVKINNGSSEVRTGSVTTSLESSKVHAKFIAGFPGGSTTLSGANVKLGAGYEIPFGGSTSLEANKFYKVNKTYTGYQLTASATIPAVSIPSFIDYPGGPKTKTTNNIELPYNKTMAEFLASLDADAATIATYVTDCTMLSGNDCISITGTPYTAPSTPANYSFSATAAGTATYKVTIMGALTIDDLEITVAQVPIVTL